MNTNSCVARTIFLERETMHRNLTTNSFAIAKHDISSIFLKMFAKFLLSIILAVSFQSAVLADITQADLDKLGANILDTTHGKLSIIDINKHPQRDEILDAMTEAQFKDFSNWQVSKTKAAQESLAEAKKQNQEAQERRAEGKKQLEEAQERRAEGTKQLEEALAEGKALDKQLVEKYTSYIGNAEILGKGSKKIFNQIVNFKTTPEALKQRARALLADKNMKWEED